MTGRGLQALEGRRGGGRAGLAAKFRKGLPPGQAGCPGSGGRNVSPGQTAQWLPTRGGPCSWAGGRPSGWQGPGLHDVV